MAKDDLDPINIKWYSNTQTIEKIKKTKVKNKKFSLLYFKIIFLFDRINS